MSRVAQTELARLETARGFEVTPQSVVACSTHAIRFCSDGHSAYLLGQKFADEIPLNSSATPTRFYVHLIVVGKSTCFYHGIAIRVNLALPEMSDAEKSALSPKILRRFSGPDGRIQCAPIRFIQAARSPGTDTRLCLLRCEAGPNVEVSDTDGSRRIVQPSPDKILLGESQLASADPNDTSGSTVDVGNDLNPDDVIVPLPTWSVPLSPGDYDILADSPPPTLPPAPSLGAHGNESGSNELVDPQIESPTPAPHHTPPATPPSPSPSPVAGPSTTSAVISEARSLGKPLGTPSRDLGSGKGRGRRTHQDDDE